MQMKLHDLFEAATSELYHNTSVYAAGKILEQGYFRLTTSAGTASELLFHKPGKFYYLSTTRSKVGDYTLHNYHIDGVVFNLNGNWLNQRYKSAPIDYWERSWARSGGVRTSEMEDRVYNSKPTIPLPTPVTKLIISIHILFEIDKIKPSLDEDRLLRLRALLSIAKKLGIPTYVYKTPNDWITQNKKKRIDIGSLIKLMKPKKPEQSWARHYRDYFKNYRELYFKDTVDKLSPDAKKAMWKLYQYPNDFKNSLEADIHNQRKHDDPGLVKLLQIFSKLNLSSSKEFTDYLTKKWDPIIDSYKS